MTSFDLDLSKVETIPPAGEHAVARDFLTPLSEDGEFLLILDNTGTEKIMRCPTAGANYLLYRREGHARNAALAFGGAIHAGIEQYECGAGDKKIVQAIQEYFIENPTAPDEYRTVQTAVQVMGHYMERCKLPDYEMTMLRGRTYAPGPNAFDVLVEQPFELPLGVLEVNEDIQLPTWPEPRFVRNIHVARSGKIDLVAFCNNRNRVVDHKTTSIEGDQFVQGFQLASQTIGYVWAAQQLWPDLGVSGFCLNAISLKKPTGSGGLMDKGPRGGKPALNFFRAYFDYSTERTLQWVNSTLMVVEDFVHMIIRGEFPLFDRHCFDKFGKCPYHDVCTIDDPNVRVRMLMSDAYKDVTWDPTK